MLFVFVFMVSCYVLFVCKCVLYKCHRVSTQLQLANFVIVPVLYRARGNFYYLIYFF
jgi:hypothetical protein